MSVEAKRGSIYRWYDENAEIKEKYVLVVSSTHRSFDKMISIISLVDKYIDADDSIPVEVMGVGTLYCHCGLPTYLHRYKLGERVDVVDIDTMDRINRMMHKQLGLDAPDIQDNLYKELYENLLEKVVDKI